LSDQYYLKEKVDIHKYICYNERKMEDNVYV